ncbi:MAG TPA: hypothetical protein VHC43_05015 [Mycobacteriales bacterium]|nr:hypothetical protein [Mycobacteriales bacterium]
MIAVGILATLGVDIAQAAGGSGPDRAAAERTYLAQLRPIAVSIHNAMAPAEKVISAITQPHAGDAYAARDALVHGDALAGLDAARAQLAKLEAPAQLAKQQHDLVTAAAKMDNALRRVRSLVGVTGMPLENAINRVSEGNLAVGAGDWQIALNQAFASEALTQPPGLGFEDQAPASRTAWIFRADRSCSAASYLIGDVVRLSQEHTLQADEAVEGHLSHMVSWLDKRLSVLPKPSGSSALPARLTLRLHTLGFTAKVFNKLRTGLARSNFALIGRGVNQLDQVKSTLRALAADMSRYGATSCGVVIGQWAGKDVAPQQSHHKAVSA